MRRPTLASALLLTALLLPACQRQPVGQVVAVVDGDEITRAELAAELRSGGDTGSSAREAALARLVERRLLARAARADALDKSQDYLIRSRQLADALLVQLLREQVGQAQPAPSDQAVTAFIRTNPAIFGPQASGNDAIRALASRMLRDRAVAQSLQQRLKAERARTRIVYQPGYGTGPAPAATR